MERGDLHVLIAGGGVAALEAALALGAVDGGRFSVELLAPEPHFWYRPTAVAEPFGLGKVRRFELAQLTAAAGATFTPGALVSVDAARRTAYTRAAGAISYDALLIACGAEPVPAIPGAITFRGPADTTLVEQLLADLEGGVVRHVAFVVPAGAVWSLPAYELALMTATWLAERGVEGAELTLVSPETSPLQLFGPEAGAAVQSLLEQHGISTHMHAYSAEARPGELLLVGGDVVACDRVVALPRLQGARIAGVTQTFEGFVPVDEHGRVEGLPGVYAAGDITTFRVKQGGIATQQAEAAVEAIAADAGLGDDPRPFHPVLRGMLLTGSRPRFLHTELSQGERGAAWASVEPLWWPPAKIVGRRLSPFLARMSGSADPIEPPPEAGVPVEVELDAAAIEDRRDRLLATVLDEALGDETPGKVGDVMTVDPLVVAPEDTIGEVAERMCERERGSALVAEYGRLIGILTSRDMLRALAGRTHSSEARVRHWMTADPIAVSPSSTLEAAAVLMTEHHIHHLPVVEGEQPVGVVGLRDVVRARANAAMQIGLGF